MGNRQEQLRLENLLQMGITTAKQGNHEGARVLFQQVLNEDKKNDRAWVWLAFVAEDKLKRQQYLETALKINPNNKAAQKALKKMTRKRSRRERQILMVGVVFMLLVAVLVAFVVLILAVQG